jgi:hypothetical protein
MEQLPQGWYREFDPKSQRFYYFDRFGTVTWLPPPLRPSAPNSFIPFGTATAKWMESVDKDDLGMEEEMPPPSPQTTAKRLVRAAIPHIRATSWGGGPHPRLGTGQPMIVGCEERIHSCP